MKSSVQLTCINDAVLRKVKGPNAIIRTGSQSYRLAACDRYFPDLPMVTCTLLFCEQHLRCIERNTGVGSSKETGRERTRTRATSQHEFGAAGKTLTAA